MKYLALDTNVYINMVISRDKNYKPETYSIIRKLLDADQIKLVVPSIVENEIDRNLSKEISRIQGKLNSSKDSIENLTWINRVNEMSVFKEKSNCISSEIKLLLNEFKSKEEVFLKESEELFDYILNHDNSIIIKENLDIFFKATQRKLYKKRPYHDNDKNSFADAVIIESLIDFTKSELSDDEILYFISNNPADFSSQKDKDLLHEDILETINTNNINRNFNYTVYFMKCLQQDFQEESQYAEVAEEIFKEYTLEQREYNRQFEEIRLDEERNSVGLDSIGSEWEEKVIQRINENGFLNQIYNNTNSIKSIFNELNTIYFTFIDNLEKADIKKLLSFPNAFLEVFDSYIDIDDLNKEFRYAISEQFKNSFSIKVENIDIDNFWSSEETFSFDTSLLKFEDFNGNHLSLVVKGRLYPSHNELEQIQLVLNGTMLKEPIVGYIEVDYGTVETNNDGQIGNARQQDITLNTDEITVEINNISNDLIDQIKEDIAIIEILNEKIEEWIVN